MNENGQNMKLGTNGGWWWWMIDVKRPSRLALNGLWDLSVASGLWLASLDIEFEG